MGVALLDRDQLHEPIAITNGVLSARVISFGASLTDLRLISSNAPLIFGYEEAETYENDGQFMGAVIGRYANRIKDGSVEIEGKRFELEKNERGENHLHGGQQGFSQQHWVADKINESSVSFSLNSLDGEAGYPGILQVSATYEICDRSTLRLTLDARTDKDTIVNLCHHPYFNFGDHESIHAHQLAIYSDRYLPSDNQLIPTGVIADVSDTNYDFQSARALSKIDYNNTYCFGSTSENSLVHHATLSGHGHEMELWSTQPGLHLYNGYKLRGTAPGHLGKPYKAYSGICLEAQTWPDSPNHEHFPNCVLRAGKNYRQVTEYRIIL